MNKFSFTLISAALISATVCLSCSTATEHRAAEPPTLTLGLQQITNKLQAPTDMAFPGNGDLWVTEQTGKIRVIHNSQLTDAPILDLRNKMIKVNSGYEERGLLSIALHPNFKTNRKFYVFYTAPSAQKMDHLNVVAEYKLAANGQVDPASARIILTNEHPDGNHNGSCIRFGPDGYLYVTFGDGGGQGDKHGASGNGQRLDTWLGKILRVNVNTTAPYSVPKDNPFVGNKAAKPEIWAYGFRNPYRLSFDKATGQLFAGEVGQDQWEEVDLVKKGGNYGWRIVEGTHCYNPDKNCDTKGITMPIAEYSHKEGVSVIGGYVYNGKQLPALKGKYLFADWTGPVFYLEKSGNTWNRGKVTLTNFQDGLKITGFSEDAQGELYLLTNPDTGPGTTQVCSLYKIVKG